MNSEFQASTAATMQRISIRMQNPRTSQTGDPRRPEKPTTIARMDIIRVEIAHDSILGQAEGLKRTNSASTAEVARVQIVVNRDSVSF
jgi:hypothetical protein